ncbi:MAG: hypothetical protein ACJAUR_001980 [Ulvibacter sp.]|jgi:hypothetical protein
MKIIEHSEKPKRNTLLAVYVIGVILTVTSYSVVTAFNTIY